MAVELKLTISDGTAGFTPVRVIAGREEISALYEYDILVRTTKPCSEVRACLEKRVQLKMMLGTMCIQTVHGIVMEIESTRQYVDSADISSAVSGEAWYKWTIRPAFAKACYSLNRLVYDEEKLSSGGKTAGEQLLDMLGQRWECPMQIETKAKAILATKKFIQFLQNDESDYNFFCRLLAHWGLGYMWKMADAKEELHVIDVSGSMDDVSNTAGEKVLIEPVSSKASMWKARYGCSSVSHAVQNYNADLPKAVDVKINLHDMEAAQFLSEHGDKHTCHGKYVDQKVVVGQKAGWRTSDCQLDSASKYCITKASIATKTYIDNAGKKAQRLEGTVAGREWPASDRGIGIVPRPVAVNERPDISDEALIRMEEPGRARSRTFMAIVVDVSECKHAAAKDRNLCKVREISPWGTGANIQLKNTLWVEMGSPFADANSGLLARPRKGNVLFCLDRGDLSIPIVLTALFRDGNGSPYAKLPEVDRTKASGEVTPYTDMTAVTIRNRTYQKDKDVSSEVVEDSVQNVMKPRSVHDLYKDRYHFSQIQLIGVDNGVYPTPQQADMSAQYTGACSPETLAGVMTGGNNFGTMAATGILDARVDSLILPVRRTHFQGINVYSEKDVLMQSADTQFINAGGSIHLTAAASITLQVGRNSIKISEKGIEIVNGCGQVNNSGAHIAYESSAPEIPVLMNSYNNQIVLNQTGIGIKGINVDQAAFNNIRMQATSGAGLTVNNWSAELTSPHTTVTGGAAILNTLVFGAGVGIGVNMVLGGITAGKGACSVYTGKLNKESVYESSEPKEKVKGALIGLGLEALKCVGGAISLVDNVKNAFSISGSMMDMCPHTLSITSDERWDVSCTRNTSETPLAALMALANSGLGRVVNLVTKAIVPIAHKLSLDKVESNCFGYRTVSSLLDKKTFVRQTFDVLDEDVKTLNSTTLYLKEMEKSLKKEENALQNHVKILKASKTALEEENTFLRQMDQTMQRDIQSATTNSSSALSSNRTVELY